MVKSQTCGSLGAQDMMVRNHQHQPLKLGFTINQKVQRGSNNNNNNNNNNDNDDLPLPIRGSSKTNTAN